MEKKLLKEINEIRSMMGLSLLTETIVDDIGKLFLNVLKKAETETIIIKGFVQPRTVKEIFETMIKGFDTLPAKEQKAVIKFMGTKEGKVFLTAYEAALAAYKKSPKFDKATFISYNKQAKLIKDELVKVTATVGSKSTSSASSSSGSISNKAQSNINSELEKKLELALKQKATFENFWVVYRQQLKASGVSWLRRPFVKNTLETVYKRSPESLNKMADDLLGVFQQKLLSKKLTKAETTTATKLITLMKTVMASIGAAGAVLLLVGVIGLVTGQVTLAEMIEFINSRITPKETAKELVKTVKDVVTGGIEGATETTPIVTPPGGGEKDSSGDSNDNSGSNKKEKKSSGGEEKPSEPKQDDYRSDDSY